MIDEKRLNVIKKQLGECCCAQVIYEDEADELIRLARLGLWAEKHAISVLKQAKEQLEANRKRDCERGLYNPVWPENTFFVTATSAAIRWALAALPKGDE